MACNGPKATSVLDPCRARTQIRRQPQPYYRLAGFYERGPLQAAWKTIQIVVGASLHGGRSLQASRSCFRKRFHADFGVLRHCKFTADEQKKTALFIQCVPDMPTGASRGRPSITPEREQPPIDTDATASSAGPPVAVTTLIDHRSITAMPPLRSLHPVSRCPA